LLFCLTISLATFLLLNLTNLKALTTLLLAWDAFSFSMVAISWFTFSSTSSGQLKTLAKAQDESLPVVFVIVLISICFSLLGTLVLLITKDVSLVSRGLHTTVTLLGVGFSWALLHTIFTVRYAHLYYDADKDSNFHKGGLEFPKEENPDYIDFAYFSFIIGMTFQVSDVNVSSRKIRRLVLLHGLISFMFNTLIVALAITTIVNIKQ
jgi:uncharacterized membrane protein